MSRTSAILASTLDQMLLPGGGQDELHSEHGRVFATGGV